MAAKRKLSTDERAEIETLRRRTIAVCEKKMIDVQTKDLEALERAASMPFRKNISRALRKLKTNPNGYLEALRPQLLERLIIASKEKPDMEAIYAANEQLRAGYKNLRVAINEFVRGKMGTDINVTDHRDYFNSHEIIEKLGSINQLPRRPHEFVSSAVSIQSAHTSSQWAPIDLVLDHCRERLNGGPGLCRVCDAKLRACELCGSECRECGATTALATRSLDVPKRRPKDMAITLLWLGYPAANDDRWAKWRGQASPFVIAAIAHDIRTKLCESRAALRSHRRLGLRKEQKADARTLTKTSALKPGMGERELRAELKRLGHDWKGARLNAAKLEIKRSKNVSCKACSG